ncbi:hypothetical protein [Pseudonocardia sp. NPDC046786]|uniref:hypothetical protein n=1 Tax=Pseudonocardia sp. NPDC046786 TaxID=3155471 RepID=UPI0033DF827B
MAGARTGPPVAALAAVMVLALLGALDQTLLTAALAVIARDLGQPHLVPAVLTAFLAATTSTMLLSGALGDRHGRRFLQGLGAGALIVGAQAALVVLRGLPRAPGPRATRNRPFDVTGSASFAVLSLSVVLCGAALGRTGGLPPWTAPAAAALAAASAIGWWVSTRRAPAPILPARLLTGRGTGVPALVSLLTGAALFGTLAGRRMTRTGRYRAIPVAGAAGCAAALGTLAALGPGAPLPPLVAVLFLLGGGAGMVVQVMVLVAQNATGPDELGSVTGTVTCLRQIGATLGVAVVGTLLTGRGRVVARSGNRGARPAGGQRRAGRGGRDRRPGRAGRPAPHPARRDGHRPRSGDPATLAPPGHPHVRRLGRTRTAPVPPDGRTTR